MGLLAFSSGGNGQKSVAQNKAIFDSFRVIGLRRRARGLGRGARGLRCMLPSRTLPSKNLIYSFKFTSLGASDTGLGASGAELGASGVCFPLEFHFKEIIICNFKFSSLGASDAELGASGAYSPPGSHFMEIRICNFNFTSLGASGAEVGASGPGFGASAAAASPLERDVMKI